MSYITDYDKAYVAGTYGRFPVEIERGEGSIFLDCGVCEGGKLGCLCLENGKEFYA